MSGYWRPPPKGGSQMELGAVDKKFVLKIKVLLWTISNFEKSICGSNRAMYSQNCCCVTKSRCIILTMFYIGKAIQIQCGRNSYKAIVAARILLRLLSKIVEIILLESNICIGCNVCILSCSTARTRQHPLLGLLVTHTLPSFEESI